MEKNNRVIHKQKLQEDRNRKIKSIDPPRKTSLQLQNRPPSQENFANREIFPPFPTKPQYFG